MLRFSLCVTHEFFARSAIWLEAPAVRSCRNPVEQLYQTLSHTQCCTIEEKGLARQTKSIWWSSHDVTVIHTVGLCICALFCMWMSSMCILCTPMHMSVYAQCWVTLHSFSTLRHLSFPCWTQQTLFSSLTLRAMWTIITASIWSLLIIPIL